MAVPHYRKLGALPGSAQITAISQAWEKTGNKLGERHSGPDAETTTNETSHTQNLSATRWVFDGTDPKTMTQPETNLPSDVDLEEGYACFHPAGNVSLEEAVMLCKQAILFARKNGIGRLLIDATQLGGFPSPSVADRYWIARDFAFAAKALVTVSFAFQSYLLDPERFGVTVATNIGMKTNAFGTKTEALAWLRNQPDLSKPRIAGTTHEGNSVQTRNDDQCSSP